VSLFVTGFQFIAGRSVLPFHSSLCLRGLSCLAVPFRGTGGKEWLTSLGSSYCRGTRRTGVPILSPLATITAVQSPIDAAESRDEIEVPVSA
jgi:hypothetical protein